MDLHIYFHNDETAILAAIAQLSTSVAALTKQQEKIMSGMDDLQAADTALLAKVQALVTQVGLINTFLTQTVPAQVAAAVAAATADDNTKASAIAADLSTAGGTLASQTAALAADLPAPAPAPGP